MRADLTFTPLADESNRYQLTKSVVKVTRMLHHPNTRVQDTMNEAFKWLGCFKPEAAEASITRKNSSVLLPAPCPDPAFDQIQSHRGEARSVNMATSFAPVSRNPTPSTHCGASCCSSIWMTLLLWHGI